MIREQHVKLFRNGRNQAVRIPREFELPGNHAIMVRERERLIIEHAPPKSLLARLEKLSPIAEQGGKPTGANDLLIAAKAIALGHVVVTDNEREFARVDGLRCENWLL